MSPNGAIRSALGGDVSRKPMVYRNIPPLVKQWRRPIIIAAPRVQRPVQQPGLRGPRTRHAPDQILAHHGSFL
ncbi:hypothetical protein HPB49_008498 [Dermacentor silvarum]|uniref:Uncharacterized protein n=1 Tax=Dermacentor silvarum TaxID=543639 RepID=A0ACB8DXU2_DERSI|nr:hypothetical protein HPB49_008498 [Dermacentor silvarum]